MATSSPANNKIPVGISSCLLGEPVRYDGGHRFNEIVHRYLSAQFEFNAFCPEVAIGLGVPRNPIQLVRTDDGIAVRGVIQAELDVTSQLTAYGKQIAERNRDLCGYIFKARSPSCGLQHVVTVNVTGECPQTDGTGAYAASLIQVQPDMPVIDEGALLDSRLRNEFIERVCARYNQQRHSNQ